jgi:ABC-type multidrug transport system ATPase subunit
MTTAYMDEAERCDQVHVLEKGKLLVEGEPREIMAARRHPKFRGAFLRRAGVRTQTAPSAGSPHEPQALPSVDVRNLTVAFGDFKAVDDVSFQVQPGEIFGFLGPTARAKPPPSGSSAGSCAPPEAMFG